MGSTPTSTSCCLGWTRLNERHSNSAIQKGSAILRITDKDRAALERFLYKRYPDREWGTFFRFGFRRTRWGIALTFIDGLLPKAGDLRRDSPIVTINSEYSLRAVDAVSESPFGIGMIHSHPEGAATFPSSLDDDMDGYYAPFFEDYAPHRPYCSLIFSRSSAGVFRFTGRIHVDGKWLRVDELLTVGDILSRESAQTERLDLGAGDEALWQRSHEAESVTADLMHCSAIPPQNDSRMRPWPLSDAVARVRQLSRFWLAPVLATSWLWITNDLPRRILNVTWQRSCGHAGRDSTLQNQDHGSHDR